MFDAYCNNCEANFQISHEMDAVRYPIEFCPFCGNDLDVIEEIQEE